MHFTSDICTPLTQYSPLSCILPSITILSLGITLLHSPLPEASCCFQNDITPLPSPFPNAHRVPQLPCVSGTEYLENQNFLAIPLWYNELALALMILLLLVLGYVILLLIKKEK